MRHIGFSGGGSFGSVGSVSDMLCFFSIIEKNKDKLADSTIFMDRLFRRYLRLEDLEIIKPLIQDVRTIFSGIRTNIVELKECGWNFDETSLDTSGKTLADVFSRYFDMIESRVESALFSYEASGIYMPVKCTITDIPDYVIEKLRPLSEYDALGPDDPPFWLR
jgi:hypothetical protein